MSARLVAIAGPLRGQTLPLEGDDLSIGRGASNRLCIADDLDLSRAHCIVESGGDAAVLRDLDSLNGTFVNGLPVKEQVLTHGDEIRVGDSILLFLTNDVAPALAGSIDLRENVAESDSTRKLRQEDLPYVQSEQVLGTLGAPRLARDLRALFTISIKTSAIRDRKTLLRELLDRIFEVVPCDRGAILLAGDGADGFGETHSKDRHSNRPVNVSHTIARRVMTRRAPLLTNDAPDELRSSDGVRTDDEDSALCVPLVAVDRVLGIIYLVATTPAARLDRGHLQLVSAVARLGAVALDNLSRLSELEDENRRLHADLTSERSIVGESPRLQEVYKIVARAAPTDVTVLILGESGTGKELAAKAIHENSRRKDKPFVAVNCAALSESLLESDLFGHVKGAFTGADTAKLGKFQVADGGTVFLDEIGELTPAIQVKLLRVLQEHEIEPVGATKPIKVNIRIVAATNRNLAEAVAKGTFRLDLYHRLNVITATMPPLRDRQEDIALLATHFLRKHAALCNRRVRGISPAAREHLLHYDWPGNIRELENVIQRALVMGSSDTVLPEDLPETVLDAEVSDTSNGTGYHTQVRDAKRKAIIHALEQAHGSYTQAARLLHLHPNNLHRLIRTLNLKAALGKP
jgi:transcriptional regulator with GAF, ATPase, and Fis domain